MKNYTLNSKKLNFRILLHPVDFQRAVAVPVTVAHGHARGEQERQRAEQGEKFCGGVHLFIFIVEILLPNDRLCRRQRG